MRAVSIAASLALATALLAPWPVAAELLRIGAASSLREVVEHMAEAFEAEHTDAELAVSYGASSVLAAQLRAGAPLDVLLLADPDIAAALARTPGTHAGQVFAHNALVVMARDPEVRIDSPRALTGPDIRRIAIPATVVPLGRYAREWLARHDLLEALESRTVRTEHARATLLAVDQGHVDAAIVYRTDARLARHAVRALEIPPEAQPAIAYVAVQGPRARGKRLAKAWRDFVAAETARSLLREAGFVTRELP